MSGFVVVALWIFALTAVGTLAVWNLARRAGLSVPTAVACGWLVGQLALGCTARVLSWMGIAWNSVLLLGGVLLLGALFCWSVRLLAAGEPPAPPRPERRLASWVGLAMAVVLLLATLSVSVRQMRSPLWSNDAIAIWALKARLFAAEGGVQAATLADPAYDFSHPEYPLLWPVTMAAPMTGGTFDDLGVTLFAPFLTLLLLGSLVGELRRRGLEPPETAALGLVFLSFEGLLGPFHVGLAELPLTVAILVAALTVTRMREHAGSAAAPLLAVALCAGLLIKNEGMVLPFAAAIVLWWPGKRVAARHLTTALAPPFVLMAAMIAVRRLSGLAVHGDVDWRWLGPGELAGRLATVAGFAYGELLQPHAVVTAVMAVIFILGMRAGGHPGSLGAFLLLVALGYLPAYLWSGRDLTWHLETTLTRIAAPLGILLLLLVGGQMAAWLREVRTPRTR
jgi:hypothetical protein